MRQHQEKTNCEFALLLASRYMYFDCLIKTSISLDNKIKNMRICLLKSLVLSNCENRIMMIMIRKTTYLVSFVMD